MRQLGCIAILLAIGNCQAARSAENEVLGPAVPRGLLPLDPPRSNPLTAAKVALGRQLFFDPRLSRDQTIGCATCHDPKKGWANGERFARGIGSQIGTRNVPSVVNAAFQHYQFWDGRAESLEGQALGPIENPLEMGYSAKELAERLNEIGGYRRAFEGAFGKPASPETIAAALASFERTLLAGNSPFDRHERGETTALSPVAERGLALFRGKANCGACHRGPNFTDGRFHNLGIGQSGSKKDLGRYNVTKVDSERGAFRTAGLRDVARTAPYMHDGSLATLEEVVEHYNQGGIANPQRDEELYPLGLSATEKTELVTFLREGLASGDYPDVARPELPK